VKPVLQALVLADRIYIDRQTGKKVIAGTFNRILFSPTPPQKVVEKPDGKQQTLVLGGMQLGSPWVYISLTDICNEARLTIHFLNVKKNLVLLSTEQVVKCDDRLKTEELVLALPALPVGEPGEYALEVLCEGVILGWHRIIAQELKVEGDPQ
jgi:hypothetical protein